MMAYNIACRPINENSTVGLRNICHTAWKKQRENAIMSAELGTDFLDRKYVEHDKDGNQHS